MADYNEHLRRHRRLTILRILNSAQAYSANESLLHGMLPNLGFNPTRDTVRGDLTWLGEQELIRVDEPGGLMIAELSERGAEVAEGRATHPGVAKPSPKP